MQVLEHIGPYAWAHPLPRRALWAFGYLRCHALWAFGCLRCHALWCGPPLHRRALWAFVAPPRPVGLRCTSLGLRGGNILCVAQIGHRAQGLRPM